jgi:hypothetical protein
LQERVLKSDGISRDMIDKTPPDRRGAVNIRNGINQRAHSAQ